MAMEMNQGFNLFHAETPTRARELAHSLPALEALLQAFLFAQDVTLSPWEFAVEFEILQGMGLTHNEVRWLLAKGYLEHATEITTPTDTSRKFGPVGVSLIGQRSCFVLTPAGFQFARPRCGGVEPHPFSGNGEVRAISSIASQSRPAILPRWDCDLREVRYDGQLVKQFKLPSPNQEAILMTFEEEDWPTRIDDPLPHTTLCDPKQRLHDTIRSLNRNQKNRLLRFKGDGTGEGVIWEAVSGTQDELPD